MRNLLLNFFMVAIFVFLPSKVIATTDTGAKGWPRMFENGGNKVVVHQPQLDAWDNYTTLTGKSAVVVQLKGEKKEYYGAIYLQADTKVDFETRTVLLDNLRVTKQIFPNIDKKHDSRCKQAVIAALPLGKSDTFSLDRILAGLERTKQHAMAVSVNLEPPPIYHSERPAILVIFMGEPQFKAIPGNPDLLYAVNTNWDIIHEMGTTRYYLLNNDSWLVTTDINNGPWKPASSLPKSFKTLPDDENWQAVKKNIPGKKTAMVPKVFISTKPAELILTEGSPEYSPISGTKLLYLTNTESDIFLHSPTSTHYFLTAGRWFKAKKISGPWTAASKDPPGDFSNIPTTHKKAYVLSSVPGTPEADAAVLLASVPRKATVDRKNTTVKVVYEGKPEFIIIDGTSSKVYYAVNSPYSVFKVEGLYYCIHDGVWFVSTKATGPWTVCTVVPQVIYTIPATHPKHNVTYVYVYD
ncbi:MAG: hypothetical protein KAJ10_01040, partial [Thermodesulfovibrionia bacterium]|nr:hypothetical protein [Thermodesulfovibrionia bacterium]